MPHLERATLLIGGLLVAGTLAVYAQTLSFDFVDYDDMEYVNEQVRRGLTADSLAWALTTGHGGLWIPLTRISLMLDVELFGTEAAGFHATNVALHILNTLLLFAVLQSATGTRWRSAAVAALFALHPLHVESVAWITERKDVLSTAFGLLSLGAYIRFARSGSAFAYAATALLLALSFMAKPMLVTWPFVFLLLDAWPLGRLRSRGQLRRLSLEKVPLLAVSLASIAITYIVQARWGNVTQVDAIPAPLRLANAVVSYVRYLGKTLWPLELSSFYPYPNILGTGGPMLTKWDAAGALMLLVVITLAVVVCRRGYVRVGWLWFLGTLFPAIGLVQVGRQAMADRYTYIPLIGLFVLVVWGGAELASMLQRRGLRTGAFALAVALLVALGARSFVQVHFWRDSVPLFERALEVNPEDSESHARLGVTLGSRGRLEAAVHHFREAVRLRPRFAEAHAKLGFVLNLQHRNDLAVVHYRRSLDLLPDQAAVHFQLGNALRDRGEREAAIRHYRRAVDLDPGYFEARRILVMLEGG
ncbi:MAG: tetratricopeptide repeat protein [Myxococcota bacterium]